MPGLDLDAIRTQALALARKLADDMQHQQTELEALASAARIIEFCRQLLGQLARTELQQQCARAMAHVVECEQAREAAWEAYAPHASTLATLEVKLAEARTYTATVPDITSTPLSEWRDSEAQFRANDRAVDALEERLALTRQLLDPLIQANGQARDALEAAEDELRGLQHALEADDVFGTPSGQQTKAWQAYMLHSGLWRSDPRSPIGLAWLERSGAGAELEARVEAGTRADVAAHGPEIRHAKSASPLWETTSGPAGMFGDRQAPGGVTEPGVPGMGEAQ